MVAAASALDALTLDAELESLLHSRLQRILATCKIVNQPEALAALRAALLWLGSGATPGEVLLGLRRNTLRAAAEAPHRGASEKKLKT